jgi:hypothetical protein
VKRFPGLAAHPGSDVVICIHARISASLQLSAHRRFAASRYSGDVDEHSPSVLAPPPTPGGVGYLATRGFRRSARERMVVSVRASCARSGRSCGSCSGAGPCG